MTYNDRWSVESASCQRVTRFSRPTVASLAALTRNDTETKKYAFDCSPTFKVVVIVKGVSYSTEYSESPLKYCLLELEGKFWPEDYIDFILLFLF